MPLMHQRIHDILDEKLAQKASFQSSYDDIVAPPHNTQCNAICAICDGWSCALTYVARCMGLFATGLWFGCYILIHFVCFDLHFSTSTSTYMQPTITYIQHPPSHETTIAVQVAQVQVEYLRQWLEGKTPPPQV